MNTENEFSFVSQARLPIYRLNEDLVELEFLHIAKF